MSPKERAEQALILLRQSEEEFAKNDIFQGSEKPCVRLPKPYWQSRVRRTARSLTPIGK